MRRSLVGFERVAARVLARSRNGGRAQPLLCELARRLGVGPRVDGRQLRDNLRAYFPRKDSGWIESNARGVETKAIQAKLLDKHVLPSLSSEQLERTCELVNGEPLERALREGRGVVMVSLHYGRYWAAAAWLSRRGARVMAFQKGEGRLPMPAGTLSGGTLNASDLSSGLRATRALRRGAVVALQLDAGRVERPLVVDFLGHPTLVTASPIHLARAADAIVLPMLAVASDRTRVRLTSYGEIDPREVDPSEPVESSIRRVFASFEEQVRADPSQWYGVATAHRRRPSASRFSAPWPSGGTRPA
jgi:lauroyl/myristoyl acyltransferase